MSLNANALISLADQKTYLQITETSKDAILELLINSVSTFLDGETNRNLKEQTYTNLLLDGNGKVLLWLPDYPVGSITLKEDGVTLVEGTDFRVHDSDFEGYLERLDDNWSDEETQNIDFTGKLGMATIPSDLQLACFWLVAQQFKSFSLSDWGEASRGFPEGNISKFDRDIPDFIQRTINRYKRIRL